MSLQTWKDEFYPVEASKAKRWSKIRAIEHSLTKWIGLREKALKRHEVFKYGRWIQGADCWSLLIDIGSCSLCIKYLRIDTGSCSLCIKYLRIDSARGGNPCIRCPLYAALGNKQCDQDISSPYEIWLDTGDPEPMIRGLRKALHAARKEAVE